MSNSNSLKKLLEVDLPEKYFHIEKIAKILEENKKLKESNGVLLNACEFYGMYYETGKTFSDFAKEELEICRIDGHHIPHGKRAREAINKYKEIMGLKRAQNG